MQEGASLAAVSTDTAPAPSAPVPVDLDDRSLFLNRQISWLAFNERVLNEAVSSRWPLLERVKFLAIFWFNLDEFFMIRVAGLHEQLEAAADEVETGPDGISPRDQLVQISQICTTCRPRCWTRWFTEGWASRPVDLSHTGARDSRGCGWQGR